MRPILKSAVNRVLGAFGARAVGSAWGPRGFLASLERARRSGFVPRTVIDIGASDGRWSESCLEIFPDARYLLFDALPDHAPALGAFANRHRNATTYSLALGECPGKMSLNVHGHQSSLLSSCDFQGGRLTLDIHMLDDLTDDLGLEGPILFKADVQGYELNVIRGATRVLTMTELALLEVSYRRIYEGAPLAHEVITAMGSYGFRIFDVCSYDQRPFDGALAQSDIVFARPTSGLFRHEGWA